MLLKIQGKEGEYIVKNKSSIFQYKIDAKGEHTGDSVLHITTDSIENNEDRKKITKKISEFNFS